MAFLAPALTVCNRACSVFFVFFVYRNLCNFFCEFSYCLSCHDLFCFVISLTEEFCHTFYRRILRGYWWNMEGILGWISIACWSVTIIFVSAKFTLCNFSYSTGNLRYAILSLVIFDACLIDLYLIDIGFVFNIGNLCRRRIALKYLRIMSDFIVMLIRNSSIWLYSASRIQILQFFYLFCVVFPMFFFSIFLNI